MTYYRFVGPQGAASKYGRPNKGVMREERARKRMEAEERQKLYMKNSQQLVTQVAALDDNGLPELTTAA